VKEILINYFQPMILAKLAGRKTQTRRIINPQPPENSLLLETAMAPGSGPLYNQWGWRHPDDSIHQFKCPFGKVDDILLSREGYQIDDEGMNRAVVGRYLADNKRFMKVLTEKEFRRWEERKYPHRATSGRFMYKSLIRFRDVITDVRVQRLQDISEEDARAEGTGMCVWHTGHGKLPEDKHQSYAPPGRPTFSASHKASFANLWDSINAGRGSWEGNPMVFAITTEPEGS